MGIFSSNKTPETPLPNFALHLATDQEHIFKPNDTVSGHVSINPAIPITPQAVEISFWGQSMVWIRESHQSHAGNNSTRRYHHYRDNAAFFTVTYNLMRTPQVLEPGQNHDFRWEFRVPEGTSIIRNGCYQNDNDERWTTYPHPLPPTFLFGSSPEDPDCATISYGVTARLICPSVGVGKNFDPLSSTANILFQPLNPDPETPLNAPLGLVRYPKRFTLSSSLLSGASTSSIGFRQRISDKFSSSTPKLDFEAGLEIPDLLTSGSEFRFRCTFSVLDKSANVVAIPAVHFRVIKLELLDFTFARAPRDWSASSTMSGYQWKDATPPPLASAFSGQESTVYDERKTLLNAVPGERVVQLEEIPAGEKKETVQADKCEVWFTGRVPGNTPSSFRSFAVSRMYRIKVRLAVEVGSGGKKFEMEAESHVREVRSAP
ncbi:hypothetical protein BS50DRAFT_574666 [Corynespora cassiicola Philippines]|uniref:Arrestin-like N-terminal domain-containing protein n=1 Tax=Corynespora cassiicola Philippines TaxID=1448308 RepID=A0A2T2NLH0_CORCC|nr:hypothetical protein BS50DRAFT_574666 [Corynespora cassiicola Philippines]